MSGNDVSKTIFEGVYWKFNEMNIFPKQNTSLHTWVIIGIILGGILLIICSCLFVYYLYKKWRINEYQKISNPTKNGVIKVSQTISENSHLNKSHQNNYGGMVSIDVNMDTQRYKSRRHSKSERSLNTVNMIDISDDDSNISDINFNDNKYRHETNESEIMNNDDDKRKKSQSKSSNSNNSSIGYSLTDDNKQKHDIKKSDEITITDEIITNINLANQPVTPVYMIPNKSIESININDPVIVTRSDNNNSKIHKISMDSAATYSNEFIIDETSNNNNNKNSDTKDNKDNNNNSSNDTSETEFESSDISNNDQSNTYRINNFSDTPTPIDTPRKNSNHSRSFSKKKVIIIHDSQ